MEVIVGSNLTDPDGSISNSEQLENSIDSKDQEGWVTILTPDPGDPTGFCTCGAHACE